MREKNTGVFLELLEFHHAKTLRLLLVNFQNVVDGIFDC